MSWSGFLPGHVWFKEELKLEEDIKMVHDKNVRSVIEKMIERAGTGLSKYGVTTERTDLDLIEWITHAQEEAMDLAIYLERIKQELGK
jgi:hypothetical protein